MEELPAGDLIFEAYPTKKEAVEGKDFAFYSLGGEYIGGGRMRQDYKDPNNGYGILLAWDKSGSVIFRGGLDYYQGRAGLGQTTGSFRRAKEHKGHRIGRKMAVVGMDVLRSFLKETGLPLKEIGFTTSPGSSMAKIGKFLGMTDEEGKGHYSKKEVPDVQKLMEDLSVRKIEPNEN